LPERTPALPPAVSKELVEGQDNRLAKQVISEIVRRCPWTTEGNEPTGVGREVINQLFWFAHLYYAKDNPGYLSAWPLIRRPWGVQILDDAVLLRQLVEEQFVRVEEQDYGPFPLAVYFSTGKRGDAELPAGADEAIQQAFKNELALPIFPSRMPAYSRAWRDTADGEEINIYLDLIPEGVYEEQQHQLEGLRETLGDLFA
jgi:hypothetical protein